MTYSCTDCILDHMAASGPQDMTTATETTEKLEWAPLWAAMDDQPKAWIPTTRGMYWAMLECVPPRAQTGKAFLVGEPLRHNAEGKAVHACFKQENGDYFARNLTVAEFHGGAA